MHLTASLRWLAQVAVLGPPFLFERFYSDWRMAAREHHLGAAVSSDPLRGDTVLHARHSCGHPNRASH